MLNLIHSIDYGEGVVFRIDGTGDGCWFLNGEYHRFDGPAVIFFRDGTEEWFLNGKLHRGDGPATFFDGKYRWFINGEELTEEEFNAMVAVKCNS